MALIIGSGSFNGITIVAESLVVWSIISYLIMINNTYSWNDDANGNPTIGLGGGFR